MPGSASAPRCGTRSGHGWAGGMFAKHAADALPPAGIMVAFDVDRGHARRERAIHRVAGPAPRRQTIPTQANTAATLSSFARCNRPRNGGSMAMWSVVNIAISYQLSAVSIQYSAPSAWCSIPPKSPGEASPGLLLAIPPSLGHVEHSDSSETFLPSLCLLPSLSNSSTFSSTIAGVSSFMHR